MRAYELMIIVDGDLDENQARAWIKQVTESVKAQGGSVHGPVDWWGRRAFTYEIKHKTHGYYAVFNILAPGGALDEVERTLRLADAIVRHKLLRLPDHEAARRGMVVAGAAG
jgi:small subunit ribosomal protein S6